MPAFKGPQHWSISCTWIGHIDVCNQIPCFDWLFYRRFNRRILTVASGR